MGTGEALAGQHRGQDAAAGCLAGLQALGERAIQDALAVPGGLAECDSKRIHHLLRIQANQLAGSRGGTEHAHRRGAMPAAIERRGEGHAARHIEAERDRQKQALAGHAAEHVRYGKARGEHRCARMDRTAVIERVVKVESVRHAGVYHRGLWRRQPKLPQHHLALRNTCPAADNAGELGDSGCAAAAKQAAKRVKDVVASGDPRGSRQIPEVGATYVLGQCPSRILDHVLSTSVASQREP